MATEPTQPIKIFYCYVWKDRELRDELEKQLSPLKRLQQIVEWHDQDIWPGTEQAHEIDTHLNTADIVLLLVSADFIASDDCYKMMQRAMERWARGETRVIPIILRPVAWQETPIGQLLVLPAGGKAVTTWFNRDEALLDVVRGIHQVVEGLLSQKRDAWSKKGDADYRAKRYSKAVIAYEQAMRLDRDLLDVNLRSPNYDAKAVQTTANLIRDDREKALDAYEGAIRLDPNNALLYKGKADLLRELLLYDEALETYNRAIRLMRNNAQFYKDKADLLRELSWDSEALETYNQAIRLMPNNAQFHKDKARILWKLSRYDEALEAYEQAIRLLKGLRRHSEVVETYDQAIDTIHDDPISYKSDADFLKSRRSKARLFKSEADFFNEIGLYDNALDTYDEALLLIERALDLDPRNTDLHLDKAELLKRLKRYIDALATCERALRLRSDNASAYYLKGELLSVLGRPQDAQQAYNKARELGYKV